MSRSYTKSSVIRRGITTADTTTVATAAVPSDAQGNPVNPLPTGQGPIPGSQVLVVDQNVTGTVTTNGTAQILAWNPTYGKWFIHASLAVRTGQNRDVLSPWSGEYVFPLVTLFPTGATNVDLAISYTLETT